MRMYGLAILLISGLLINTSPSAAATQNKEVGEDSVTSNFIIIHAGKLLAVPGQNTLERYSILIEDNRIVEIRPGFVKGEDIDKPNVRIVDMKDNFVMPGLMDVHVHLASDPQDRNDVDLDDYDYAVAEPGE